jgi:putative ABC transport system permease protein
VLAQEMLFIALRTLRSHKWRSALTTLGLVIGVAAVILLTALGQGVAGSVNAAVKPVADAVIIAPILPTTQGGPSAKPLTDHDAESLAAIPGIVDLVPYVDGSATGAVGQVSQAVVVQVPGANYLSATVIGTTANYADAAQRFTEAGTFFTETQAMANVRVAVLGPLVANSLFGPNPNAALDKIVRVNHRPFRVIGVMKAYGQGQDNAVVMPEGAARAGVFGYGYGGDEVSGIAMLANSTAEVNGIEARAVQILRANHHIHDPKYDDFQVQDLGSRVSTFTQLIQLITSFVPAIAAISLLVGGIGVLNIMLLSVADRTKEIGTRKAVGASDSAILLQFVLEAITLAGLGGLLGVMFGVGMIFMVKLLIPLFGANGFLSTFNPILSVTPIAVAFFSSLIIGLFAGGYPAWRAAQLKPVEALRFE